MSKNKNTDADEAARLAREAENQRKLDQLRKEADQATSMDAFIFAGTPDGGRYLREQSKKRFYNRRINGE